MVILDSYVYVSLVEGSAVERGLLTRDANQKHFLRGIVLQLVLNHRWFVCVIDQIQP